MMRNVNVNKQQNQQSCQTSVMCRAVDNLELLLSQPDESVDLIYCDILYGTGRNFGDYQDLKPIRSEIENHYLPRLIEMKRVLKSTGSIYLQMDYRINHWVRCIMDDIFGYDKYLNEIAWVYDLADNSKTNYPKKHDCILFYKKGKTHTFNCDAIRIDYDSATKKRYNGTNCCIVSYIILKGNYNLPNITAS